MLKKKHYEQRLDSALSTQGFYETVFRGCTGKEESLFKDRLKEFFRKEQYSQIAINYPEFKGLYKQDKSDKQIFDEAKEVKNHLDKKRLDNTGLFFERDTTYTDPNFYTLSYKPLGKWRNWFEIQNIELGKDFVRYVQFERTGQSAKLTARGDGTVDFSRPNAKEYLNKQKVYNAGYYFTYAEIRAAIANNTLEVELVEATKQNTLERFEQLLHDNMILGDSEAGVTGFINAPNVPNVEASAPATGTDKTWQGGDKTKEEIIADINGMATKIIDDNFSAYGESGFIIALPSAQFNYITGTPRSTTTDTTIASQILENFKAEDGSPVIRGFALLHELKGKGTGSTDMAICFRPNEGDKIKARVSEGVIFHPPTFNQLRIEYAMEQEAGGLTIMKPLSMTQLYGI
jgi:hypothetical protein